jgi:hypothetical protein
MTQPQKKNFYKQFGTWAINISPWLALDDNAMARQVDGKVQDFKSWYYIVHGWIAWIFEDFEVWIWEQRPNWIMAVLWA